MAGNAKVVRAAVERPWELERRLLASLQLPLNLRDNKHPFVPTLQQVRKAAKDRAKMLPVVEDNGGVRRVTGQPLRGTRTAGHCVRRG
jgi:hypothetical protein